MTVTIHFPAAPAAAAAIVRRLVAIAGTTSAVRSGHGGAVVSDELALAYLSAQTPAPVVPTPAPVPVQLAQLVRDAEGRGGLLNPVSEQVPEPTTQTRAAARRPRRQRGATS